MKLNVADVRSKTFMLRDAHETRACTVRLGDESLITPRPRPRVTTTDLADRCGDRWLD